MGRKLVAPPPFWGGGTGFPYSVTMAEAYLHAKVHLDPSNHLATIHQRHTQDRTDRQACRQRLIAYGEPFWGDRV